MSEKYDMNGGACIGGAYFPDKVKSDNSVQGTFEWFWADGNAPDNKSELLPRYVRVQTAEAQNEYVHKLEGMAKRVIDERYAPEFLIEAMINQKELIRVPNRFSAGGGTSVYQLLESVDDKASGFKAAAYVNEHGHAVIIFPGMEGRSNVESTTSDVLAYWQMEQGVVGPQLQQALEMYGRVANHPAVSSVETVGMSLGSGFTNYLAAAFGAKATNLADFGLPDMRSSPLGISVFDEQDIQKVRDNVVSFRVKGDMPPGPDTLPIVITDTLFGHGGKRDGGYLYIGEVYGKEYMLPRPTDTAIRQKIHEMTPQHDQYVDERYPCTDGLEHAPQAYVVAMQGMTALDAPSHPLPPAPDNLGIAQFINSLTRKH